MNEFKKVIIMKVILKVYRKREQIINMKYEQL